MESIFNYDDYRKYLREWIQKQPKRGRGILTAWSQLLRIETSVMSQILSGKRELTPDQTFELQTFMGLGELESDYLNILVQIERATTQKLKVHLKKKQEKLKQESLQLSKRLKKELTLSEEQKSIFYSSWLYSAVRLATSLKDPQNIDSLSERFQIEREKTLDILNFLMSAGLILEDMGTYKMGPQRTHLEKSSPFINKHHANWRLKALQRSENLSAEELMFTGPLSISKKDFLFIREELVQLISKVSNTVKDTEAEELAVFEVDLFWLK
jgi:uncharacterized protein (TIGR02147 family)